MWKTVLIITASLNNGYHFIIHLFKQYNTITYLSNEIMIILQHFAIGTEKFFHLFNMCLFYILKVLKQNGRCDDNYYQCTNDTKMIILAWPVSVSWDPNAVYVHF
jgi:hypothetical protein